jgi:hypothetical protein
VARRRKLPEVVLCQAGHRLGDHIARQALRDIRLCNVSAVGVPPVHVVQPQMPRVHRCDCAPSVQGIALGARRALLQDRATASARRATISAAPLLQGHPMARLLEVEAADFPAMHVSGLVVSSDMPCATPQPHQLNRNLACLRQSAARRYNM